MKALTVICFLFLAMSVTYCGKAIDGPNGACLPVPVANAGGDQWLELGNTDVAVLGVPAKDEFKYDWSGPDGLNDYHTAQPRFTATKAGNFFFTLKVTSVSCATSITSTAWIRVLSEPKTAGYETIEVKDRFGKINKYPTGYAPSRIPKHVTYVHIPKDGYGPLRGLPEPQEMDFTPPNFIVHRQPEGSCWAEGASSSGTANVYKFFSELWRVSAQRIIDCSGYGSARGGGEISVGDFVKPLGMVDESVYTYDGHDHKCDKAKSIFKRQASRVFEIASESGGSPSVLDHKHAMMAFGVPEVCGAAGVMGNGGWVSNVGTGSTNHCYARFEYFLGELHGQPAGIYFGEQNSWGTGFGGGKDLHPGQGAYRVADANGKWLRTSIETEYKYMEMDNPCPPPILEGYKDKTIRQIDKTPQFVVIGANPVSGQTYSWDHTSDIKGPSNKAQVDAAPLHTTKFTETAQNSCAEAHVLITVHVVEDIGGHLFEITETGPKEIKDAEWF